MRIIHISIARKITSGQRRQLESEYHAAIDLSGASWKTVVYDNFKSDLPFMRQIPLIFRPVFLRNLYGWIVSLYYSKKYDYVLLRHMTFDPFSFFFSPIINNRISVHHAKEVEELQLIRRDWRGAFASALERRSGAFTLRNAVAIAGVTNEIANYEKERSNASSKTILFPNGINTDRIDCINDDRRSNIINIAFICGTFSEWHGLDKLIEKLKIYGSSISSNIENIHLIGNIPDKYINIINKDIFLSKLFHLHGFMEESEYRKILDICDIGLSSFALEREGLTEACTLKVRELLAMGLPIYSGHIDCAISENFKYYIYDKEININSMIEFGFKMKAYNRHTVAQSSKPFIDKKLILNMVVKSIMDIDPRSR